MNQRRKDIRPSWWELPSFMAPALLFGCAVIRIAWADWWIH